MGYASLIETSKFPRWQAITWIVVALCAVYFVALSQSDFVALDDGLLITKNYAVHALNFRTFWKVFTSYDPELYIPLTFLSYQITHVFFGLNAIAYHVGNFLLHVGSSITVFFLLDRLLKHRWGAFIGALIFALHPQNVETVMWAAARKDVLASFFGLLSLLCAVRASDGEQRFAWRSSTILFLLALLSKVSVATIPFIFLEIEWWRGRLSKSTFHHLAWQFGLCVVFIAIAIGGKAQVIRSTTPLETVLLAARSTFFYVEKFFVPVHLSVVYPGERPIQWFDPTYLIGVVFVLALLAAAWFLRKTWPAVTAAVVATAFILLPNETNFIKNGFLFFASDRYFYLASLSLVAFVAASFTIFLERRNPSQQPALAYTIPVILTLILGPMTYAQANTWQTSETMYTNVLAHYPRSALAWNNMGSFWLKADKFADAEKAFTNALEIDPTQMSANLNMSDLEKKRGNLAAAEKDLKTAIATVESKPILNQEELAPYYYLGELYAEMGKRDESIKVFSRAADRAPQYADPHYNLGLQLQKQGRNEEAILQFAAAIYITPTYLDARYHLSALLAEKGMLPEAMHQLEEIVKYVPTYEKAADHLANMKTMVGAGN